MSEETKPVPNKFRENCECCGYEAGKRIAIYGFNGEFGQYCHFCARTRASRLHRERSQESTSEILRAICYVGNVLLDAINAKKSSDPDAKVGDP